MWRLVDCREGWWQVPDEPVCSPRVGQSRRVARQRRHWRATFARGRWPLVQSEYDFWAAQAGEWLGGAPAAADDDPWPAPTPGRGCGRSGGRFQQPAGACVRNHAAPRSSCGARPATASTRRLAGRFPRGPCPMRLCHPPLPRLCADLEGRHVLGSTASGPEVATRVASPSGLPWTLDVRPSSALTGAGRCHAPPASCCSSLA